MEAALEDADKTVCPCVCRVDGQQHKEAHKQTDQDTQPVSYTHLDVYKRQLQTGDQVTFLATQEKAHEFFQRIHLAVRPVRNALIVGGGAIAFYLSQEPVSYTHLVWRTAITSACPPMRTAGTSRPSRLRSTRS